MPRNASGVYTLPAGNPVVPGTTIDTTWANDTMEDLANEITNSLSRTGAGGMLAPFRIADGTVTGPGLSYLNETNSGLYRSGAGSVWMSILGSNIAQFSTVGLTIPSGKALTAQGNASVSGTLSVTGATTLSSTLAVTGAITATGGVIGNIAGNVTAATGSSSFNDVVINGSLDMVPGSSATITGLSTPTLSSDAANKGYVDTQVATRLALTGGTMTGAIAMSNNKVTGVATPTADQDAANKAYVDGVAQGIDAKASCRVATTANITLSGTQMIDGVTLVVGDRVLVKNQTNTTENGIYVVASGAWTRPADANTCAELSGAFTFIEDGVTNYSSGWVCTTNPDGIIGIQSIQWTQFSGAGQINAGTGMTKTGNTLNVNTASSSRIVVGADEIDLAITGVTASTYKSVTVDQWGRVTAGTNPTTLSGYGITDAYTQAQVDTALALKLNLTGGTMSGAIAMGANKITGVSDPTNPQDAATKNYIDTIFGSTTSAAASAAAAATSASNASSSAAAAASSATAAAGSATSASNTYTTFNNQYLGSKASDPSVNNTGGALVAGNLYWNSTASEMRVYNGSAWVAAYIPAAGYLALTGGTLTGSLGFNGTALRITGDMSNATRASRLMFQTSTANNSTYISALPSGSGTAAGIDIHNSADPDNASFARIAITSTNLSIRSAQSGTGAQLPTDFLIGTSVMARLATTGNLLIGTTTDNNTDKLQVNGSMSLATALTLANGGTGATTAAGARTNLGLGTAATMAGPSGAIVGTTDTQTLTNKTIAFANNTLTGVAGTGAANTFTATQTFSGSSSALAMVLNDAAEIATVSATAATGTINYDITTQSVLFYTTNASGNFTVNLRASSGTSLNTALSTGQSVTVAFLVTNGATAYYNTTVQVDGTTSGVTTRWQGGTAPSAGNASAVDVYVYTIIKTANATFSVFASQTQFK